MKEIKVRCNADLDTEITTEAARLGLSKSAFLSRLASQYFRREVPLPSSEKAKIYAELSRKFDEICTKTDDILTEILASYRDSGASYDDTIFRKTMVGSASEISKILDDLSRDLKKIASKKELK